MNSFVTNTVRIATLATLWIVGFSFWSYKTQKNRMYSRTVLFYFNLFLTIWAAYLCLTWQSESSSNVVFVLFNYIINCSKIRYCLLLFWSICVVSSVAIIALVSSIPQRKLLITTNHRKFFHLTVSLVYISGLQFDPEILYLAGALVACAMVVIECVRLLKIYPCGYFIDELVQPFLDEQDSGVLILTPLFLFFGTFLPLWLKPVSSPIKVNLRHFAGIVSVGFGDTFAAILGRKFGTKHWPNSRKTLQGSIGCAGAQFIGCVMCLLLIRELNTLDWGCVIYLSFVSIVTALAEVVCGAFDNILLPLITYLLLFNW